MNDHFFLDATPDNLEEIHKLENVVLGLCERPAELYGVSNKGYSKAGLDADLTPVDRQKDPLVKRKSFYKSSIGRFKPLSPVKRSLKIAKYEDVRS